MLSWLRSFRVQMTFLILLVAGLPLAVVGQWMTRSGQRLSEQLLRSRVAEALEKTAATVSERWVQHRSRLLDLAEDESVLQILRDPAIDPIQAGSDLGGADPLFFSVTLIDPGGQRRVIFSRAPEPGVLSGTRIPLTVQARSSRLGPVIGSLEALVPADKIIVGQALGPGGIGISIGVFDATTGAPFILLPFEWEPEQWIPFSGVGNSGLWCNE